MGDEKKKIEFLSGSKLAPTRGGLGVWCAEVEDIGRSSNAYACKWLDWVRVSN
jgi:hypothetical protein